MMRAYQLGGHAYSPHWNGENIPGARRMIVSGNEMIYVPARAMKITWGQDPRFWKWIHLPGDISKAESTPSAAELVQVNWLEVTGSVDLANYQLPPAASRTYEVVFRVMFRADAFGWSKSPVTLLVVSPGGRRETRRVAMEAYRSRGTEVWHEIHGGEFKLPYSAPGGGGGGRRSGDGSNRKVEFGMLDVNSQGWKGGMVFAGVTIRPSSRPQQTDSNYGWMRKPSCAPPSSAAAPPPPLKKLNRFC